MRSNRTQGGRWFLAFQRDAAGAPWKVAYLSVLRNAAIPEFAKDAQGYVKAVPAGTSGGLSVPPGKISETYTRFLQEGGGDFAPGPQTSGLRKGREERQARFSHEAMRADFSDVAAKPPEYTPLALRTEDGGALVFFASHHYEKQTAARGHSPQVSNKLVRTMLRGEPKQSVIYTQVAQQAVNVPSQQSGGDIRFLNRLSGITGAKGQ